ncbi:hypothetical protein FNV43_RR16416 [Rhamnella rubrinervis]|uniref:Uncharacterized protein n=1 Tax=Rhamnella rubrinervis TaxID=2594499 RepID=A0A8K0GYS9_9ROSA|nr:hypothetical protein FNV43_RR16416 [Rhamnella rubrinervis]
MKVPEGGLFFTEELSVKRTITTGEVSSQANDAKLVDIVVERGDSHANSSLPAEWLKSIMKDGAESSSTAKIPKVPKMFRDSESNKGCFDPLAVSIGPYHHGKPELQEVEKLKIKMAKQYVNGTIDKSIQADQDLASPLYQKVKDVAGEAKTYYDFESSPSIDDESFTKMMFLDGCFVLQYIYSSVYAQQEMGMKIHHIAFVQRDLFLLENQLPYIVLHALMSTRLKAGEGKKMIHKFIKLNQVHHPPPTKWRNCLRNFISFIFQCKNSASQQSTDNSSSTKDDQPLHLLDMMRKTLVGPEAKKALGAQPAGPDDNWSQRYQSAKELKTVGIRFRANKSSYYTDVKFSSTRLLYGKLTLPPLSIDDSTKSMLLNMLAFETCPDCPDDFWVTSYICFIDSLINNAEDVTLLRSQNILLNYLGSDQDVADLFNGIAKYLAPNPRTYVDVKKQIKAHYNNRFKIWMAEWLDDHFSSPWTVLAFLGAVFAIFLSVIQTYVAIHPPSS